jgi:predicted ATP-grasp superfamily ATP-dependent carboligase
MLQPSQVSILLLDGHSPASLAFTRSLARAGIRVTVGAAVPDAPARFSRFCVQFLLYPSPMEDPEAFRQWLFEILSRCQFDLLIGTTDQTLLLLDEWRELLSSRVKVPLPAREGFRLACDKAKTAKQAQELGLAVPPTCFIQNEEEFDHAANTLRPPFVIKPRSSIGLRQGQRLRLSVAYAFNKDALRQKYFALHRFSPWPLLQSYVAGFGMGCFFLIRDGEIMARFMHRRIRDVDPTGSGSSLRISVAPDPTLMRASEQLLRAIGVDGLVMVEYRVGDDGTPYLMEINSRPWGSMQLAVESGVDFPLLWYRAVSGQPVEIIHSYRQGVVCRHLVGDLRHLESVLLGPPPGWSLDFPKRLPTLLQFLKFWGTNLRYDDFAAGDWRPGLAELRNYFVELGGRFLGRLRRAFTGTRKSGG